ncbi:MAG: LysE family transporter [Flavobacteriaceae bacterium]|nr:LysE family transporter [Flavobacteriaceae bacterium]MBL6684844.1 LysE family transporter [Flavobacteriaceae bacterium]
MADYIDAVVFGFILSFSFGPIFFILLETSITRGIKQAVFMDFGVIVSDLLFFSLAYFGASKIATEENQPALFLLGGVILTVYSVVSFINNVAKKKKIKKAKAVEETRLLKYTVKGFLLNIINVSYLVIWAGVIVWFGPKVEMSPVKIWTFFIVSVITYLAINLLKFLLSSRLKSKLTDKVLFYIRQGLNILILIFGIVLIFKGL